MRVLLLCFLLVVYETHPERIVIHTKQDERAYNFFPLKTNYLEFTVKATNDIHIVLSNSYNLEMSFYEIVIGGWLNTRSAIRRDGVGEVVGLNATLIQPKQFQTYWVATNDTEGTVSFGMEPNKALMVYKDPHYVKKSYFGIATGYKSPGIWNFDFEMLKCYL